MDATTTAILAFLARIGIPVEPATLPGDTLLPALTVHRAACSWTMHGCAIPAICCTKPGTLR